MAVLQTFAPAKINLHLRVVRRLPNGYHELETLFAALTLGDDLSARRVGSGVRLTMTSDVDTGLPVRADDDNLVVRAGRSVLEAAGGGGADPGGLEFRLHKRVPAGGGLGGGSSDAAAALRLGNALLGDPLSAADLADLAVRLGADVPFFLVGGVAWAGGIGERLEPVPTPPEWHCVLIVPPFGTSTPAVFKNLEPKLIDGRAHSSFGSAVFPTPTLSMRRLNDLEVAAMTIYPELRSLRDLVQEGGVPDVMMSGSGSTLFVARGDAAEADAVAARVEALVGSRARILRTRTLSGLPPIRQSVW